jgi:hypothetical protein
MKSERSPEEHQLLCEWLAGALRPEDAARLTGLARADAGLRKEMAALLVIERMLRHQGLVKGSRDAFAQEVVARLREESMKEPRLAERVVQQIQGREDEAVPSSPSRVSREAWWSAQWGRIAAGLILVAAVAAAVMTGGYLRSTVAVVAGVEAAEWAPGQRMLTPGTALRRQSLEIASGFVSLRFPSGATVLLEGPARLKLLGEKKARLEHGKAVAEVPPAALGFVLESPDGRILDLGTKFGVRVGVQGGTEVHVLQGKVQATGVGETKAHDLEESEGVLLAASGAVPMVADKTLFLTHLPPRRSGPVRCVHWAFDEGKGNETLSVGDPLPGTDTPTKLLSLAATGQGNGPKWVKARFGSGLAFDGKGDYAASAFKGIEGGSPRTVAFWFRVPEDWQPINGFALVSWGTHMVPGGVWQISVNPEAKDGLVGRLRVGVQGAQVIGARDLRDGQWHHAAAVLYAAGDEVPTTTQILLYVDGQLEPAERRAVQAVQTKVNDEAAIPVTFGRNSDALPAEGRQVFRGALDEVFILDTALTQEEIVRLAKQNSLATQAH